MNKTYNLWKKTLRSAAKAGLCALIAVGLTACGNLPGEDAAGAATASEAAGASVEQQSESPSASPSASSGGKGDRREEPGSGTAPSSSSELHADSATVPDRTVLSDRDKDASWNPSSPSIVLNGSAISVNGSGASVVGSSAVISQGGTYIVSGTLTDGRITVAAGDSDDVQIVLNGADITSSDGPAIVVENADNVVITLADGTENSVTDGSSYGDTSDTAPDAAIYSDCDLAVNGSGSLKVSANYNNGVYTRDDLAIAGGRLVIDAANNGLKGKDSVSIADGDFTISAGGDGIQSDKDDDPEKGWVVIDGGTFRIEAANDGIQAETGLVINDGTFDVTTGGGSENGKMHSGNAFGGVGGKFDPSASGSGGNFGGRWDDADPSAFGADRDFVPWSEDFDPSQFDPSSEDGYGGHGSHQRPGRHNGDPASDGTTPGSEQRPSSGQAPADGGPDGITSPSITDDRQTAGNGAAQSAFPAARRTESSEGTAPSEPVSEDTAPADSSADAAGSGSERPTKPGGSQPGNSLNTGGSANSASDSTKGLKSGLDVTLNGGTFQLNCADDAVHANNDILISEASLTIASGDDALHADGDLTISADIDITASYEGIEGANILIEDGSINVISSDDGINASDDNGEWGSSCSVEISGGSVYVQAGGDGIDSNGDILISGGETVVLISSSADNGAIDAEGAFKMTGGTAVYGGTGIGGAPQGSDVSYVYASGEFPAGSAVSVRGSGQDLMSADLSIGCGALIFAGEDLTKGQSYGVYSGGNLVSTVTAGEGAPSTVGGFGGRGNTNFGSTPRDGSAGDTSSQPADEGVPDGSSAWQESAPARPERPSWPDAASESEAMPTFAAASA